MCLLEKVRALEFQERQRIGELESEAATKSRREGMQIPKELKKLQEKKLTDMKIKVAFHLRLQEEILGVIQTGVYQCRSKGSNLRTNLE